jgi:hypothetical protein
MPGQTGVRPNRILAAIEAITVVVCTPIFAFMSIGIVMLLLSGNGPSQHDSLSYWAAGRQLIHHRDPYDVPAVLRLERTAGYPARDPALMMRNPPQVLLLALPLGFVGLRTAALLWTLFLLVCLSFAVQMCWRILGRPGGIIRLLGYSFGPALACLLAGQSSLVALLGLVTFLRFHRAKPLLAGLGLWLCTLKPHLFLPFGIVLLAWILVRRAYGVLIGLSLGVAAGAGVVLLLDPSVWVHYHAMFPASGVTREFIPCLSVALRLWIRPFSIWLQFVPAVIACLWAVYFFWKRKEIWDWSKDGSLLMVISIMVAPYCWFTDQALLIPAVLYAACITNSRYLLSVLALISAAIELMLLCSVSMHSPLYLWTAPAFLAWYVFAVRDRTGADPMLERCDEVATAC